MAKGGKGRGNSEAINLQKESMRQSALASSRMEAMMKQSIEQAREMKLPTFQGSAPMPRMSGSDAVMSALEFRRNLQRRSGMDSTKFASAA